MKSYLIVYSIILVLLFGTFFLFTGKTIKVETIDFPAGETEKALEEFELQIKFPHFIPDHMVVRNASITMANGDHEMIGFRYSNPINSYGFEFYASRMSGNINEVIKDDGYWKWKKTKINGMESFIGRNGKNTASMEMNIMIADQDILYQFYSKGMKTEELLQIAGSLK